MWTLLQLNTSTILSYSRSVEPENHQIKSKPKSTSVTQFLWFSSVSQAQDSGSSEMQMVLGHTPSGFLLSTAHTSCLLLSDGIGPHLSLIWLVITEVLASPVCSGLHCNEATPSTMDSSGLSQHQAGAVFYLPFDPSAFRLPKPIPPGKFLHMILFDFQHEKQTLSPFKQTSLEIYQGIAFEKILAL